VKSWANVLSDKQAVGVLCRYVRDRNGLGQFGEEAIKDPRGLVDRPSDPPRDPRTPARIARANAELPAGAGGLDPDAHAVVARVADADQAEVDSIVVDLKGVSPLEVERPEQVGLGAVFGPSPPADRGSLRPANSAPSISSSNAAALAGVVCDWVVTVGPSRGLFRATVI
jgi:hypothetical protein